MAAIKKSQTDDTGCHRIDFLKGKRINIINRSKKYYIKGMKKGWNTL